MLSHRPVAPQLDAERRSDALVLVGAAVVAIAVAVASARTLGGDDLAVYRATGRALLDGVDPYVRILPGTTMPSLYTPFTALLLLPLALLPAWLALPAITLTSLGCLWFVVDRVVLVSLPGCDAPRRHQLAVSACVLLLLSEPISSTLNFGQVNLIVLALIVGDLLRPAGSRAQGVGLGVAISFKLIPAVVVLYLLCTRRFRAARLAITTFAATIAIGFLVMPRGSVSYWIDGRGADAADRLGSLMHVPNESILAALARAVGADRAHAWWLALVVPLVAAGLWASRRIHRRWGDVAGLAAIVTVGELVSPVSWSHHWVWFIPPAVAAGARGWYHRRRTDVAAAVLLVTPFLLPAFRLVPKRQWLSPSFGTRDAVAAGAYVWVGLGALAAAVVFATRSERPRPAVKRA